MTRKRQIVLTMMCAVFAVLLWPNQGSAQALAGPAPNFGFIVDQGEGIVRGNAIAVDSKNVYFAYYYLGDLPSGRPPEVMYEAFPLVLTCPVGPHVSCGFVPPIASTIDVIGPVPTVNGPNVNAFAYTIAIALGPDGTPHIVYQDGVGGGIKHAELCPCADNVNDGWQTEVIPIPTGYYVSLAVDKSGTVHVVSSAGGVISYINKSKGVWSAVESVFGPASLSALSLAVDSSGNPQLVYADHRSTFNDLVYAPRGTTAPFWNSSNFDTITSDDAVWASLALNSADVPSVSYWGWPSNGSLTAELVYASRLGPGSWAPQLVDSFAFPCCISSTIPFQMTSLGFSPKDLPRISYAYDYSATAGVALARYDGIAWSTQPLDSDPLGGLNSTSIVVDYADISHVLYKISNCPPSQFCSDLLYYERISTVNTPIGINVGVNLGDPAGYKTPITVTFSTVSQAGYTTVTVADPGAGPALPSNFELGNPPIYYDFSTSAVLPQGATITVCVPYGSVSNPSNLQLMHYENGQWVNRTSSINILSDTICAQVSSFSPIAVTQPTGSGGPGTSSITTLLSSTNPSVYGQPVTFTAQVSGSSGTPTGTVTLSDGSTTLGTAMLNASGMATFAVPSLSAGTHNINASYGGDSIFLSSTSSLTQTVNPAALNVSPSPSNAAIVYGQSLPAFTATPTGFVNGDNSSALSGTLSCTTTPAPATSVGTYSVSCAGLSAANYTITYAPGTLTINPAPLTVTANNFSVVYGQALPALTVSPTGFVNGDNSSVLSGTLSCTTSPTPAISAGTYAINCSGLSATNYTIMNVPGMLVIKQAPLTIEAFAGNSYSRPYGAGNATTLVPVVMGLVNGDVITATDTPFPGPASPVGSYTIVPAPSGAQSVLNNYAISRVNGTINVVPETTSLAVTLSPTSIVVGQSSTATVTLTGPDMAVPIDPSVLAGITLTSTIASDVISNGGTCTPVPATTPGTASCTLTITSSEPNGRTLTANFAGSADLTLSTGTAQLIVTEPVQGQQSCIASDFRNVAVGGGNYIWFNSIVRVRDVSQQKINISFANSTVQFQYTDASGNVVPVNLAVPSAQIVIDPSVSVASTSFDPVNNVWNTTLPWDLDDNAFLAGIPWLVPAGGLPADVEPVTWCGTFAVSVSGAHVGWRWAAAAYSSFSPDNSALGVVPLDVDHDNPSAGDLARDHDHAGTPEGFEQFVIPGARGKGGRNYTGSYSHSAKIE